MRTESEIRRKKTALQDLRQLLVQKGQFREALDVELKLEALLWVLGCDWNERWYEDELKSSKHAREMKSYLGDGVYVELVDGPMLRLTTENGDRVTNEIFLEPEIAQRLCAYWDKLKREWRKAKHQGETRA